ncbi:hypothetical protein T4A_1222 [Trichinella pseudospiralis]|uniref:Retrotransposon gag domain-containing protein n=1 Tax=Trichinella pseudospiralis TaxID=6337 RepID=A0A0V1EMR2_TRIPS|nr:hypothetical protein T4A_1222 [Trichinella pseudospiralis]
MQKFDVLKSAQSELKENLADEVRTGNAERGVALREQSTVKVEEFLYIGAAKTERHLFGARAVTDVVFVEVCSENVDEKTRPSEREGTRTKRRRGSGGRSTGPTQRVVTMVVPGRLLLPAPSFSSKDGLRRVAGVRRELYPAGQARENSFEEFKTRLLSTNGPGLSTGQLTERFHALHQREGQTNEQYAQEVAEVGRRAGVSERDLVARFARGITSKQAYLAMRLQEPQTLAEARKLVSKVVQAEEDFHQSRQSDTRNPKPEKTEVAQSIDALIHARWPNFP